MNQGDNSGKTRFPTIETMNRRAAKKTDVRNKLGYFRKLLNELDAEIGQETQTYRELMHAGELVDPEPVQLYIERLELLRTHAARHLEFISQDPLANGPGSPIADSVQDGDSLDEAVAQAQGDDDDLLTVQELADLLGLSKSWVQHNTSAKSIPHIKIGQSVRFRRGDIKEWLLNQRKDSI